MGVDSPDLVTSYGNAPPRMAPHGIMRWNPMSYESPRGEQAVDEVSAWSPLSTHAHTMHCVLAKFWLPLQAATEGPRVQKVQACLPDVSRVCSRVVLHVPRKSRIHSTHWDEAFISVHLRLLGCDYGNAMRLGCHTAPRLPLLIRYEQRQSHQVSNASEANGASPTLLAHSYPASTPYTLCRVQCFPSTAGFTLENFHGGEVA